MMSHLSGEQHLRACCASCYDVLCLMLCFLPTDKGSPSMISALQLLWSIGSRDTDHCYCIVHAGSMTSGVRLAHQIDTHSLSAC